MHGWAGRQEQFGPLVRALVAAGYGVAAQTDAPVLVLHDRGDRRSSYAAAPGHRRILADPAVASAVVGFLAAPTVVPR